MPPSRWVFALLASAASASAAAQGVAPPPPPVDSAPDVAALEQVHREAIHTRRALSTAVLSAGVVSLAAGGLLFIPDTQDHAWWFAAGNTLLFGAINTVVGAVGLAGIAREERAWEAPAARAARRTPEGLRRAYRHALLDERRESVGHTINLGLDFAYLGVAGVSIIASQSGAPYPNRWLATGVAVGIQAAYLVVIDTIGLLSSRNYFVRLVERCAPVVAVGAGPARAVHVGLAAAF